MFTKGLARRRGFQEDSGNYRTITSFGIANASFVWSE